MRLCKRDRWFSRLALALTVAAVAAPPVQATGYSGGPELPTWTVSWAEAAPQAPPEFPTWTVSWAPPETPKSSPTATPTSFDYGDAGIGATVALGAGLLAGTGFWALRRGRRPAATRL